MKICVLGLDGATPHLTFADERLVNIRRLMELGVYGKVEGVLPPGAVPGWICLTASQDPGSLGVYGPRNRLEHSYSPPATARPPAIQGSALWDQVASEGKKTILFAVPPNSPPRALRGISIGCFLMHQAAGELTIPAGLQNHIRQLLGDYPADISLNQDKDAIRHQIFEMSRKQWELVRWLLREQEWDYFHFVDVGWDRVQRTFWNHSDPQPAHAEAGSPRVVSDYYRWLDEQIGSVLELLDAETVLLLASSNGMEPVDGCFAMNQWLIEQGLLVLNQTPGPGIASFEQVSKDWTRTRAWSEGGPCAFIYLNVEGREPNGIVSAAECDSLRDQITERLKSLRDAHGQPLGARVFRPSEIYRQTRHVAPDLVVQLGEGRWCSVATIGHPSPYIHDLTEACTPCGPGIFVLTSPNCPLAGEFEGAHLLDLAPTLLDLAGYQIPASMQGHSLVAGMEKKRHGSPAESDQIIMDRLAGLGYV